MKFFIFRVNKKPYVNAYKRAQQTYERIQKERKEQAENRLLEKQKREANVDEYLSMRKRMNKAINKSNKKGQPKLDAQIAVLVEKIQRRVDGKSNIKERRKKREEKD